MQGTERTLSRIAMLFLACLLMLPCLSDRAASADPPIQEEPAFAAWNPTAIDLYGRALSGSLQTKRVPIPVKSLREQEPLLAVPEKIRTASHELHQTCEHPTRHRGGWTRPAATCTVSSTGDSGPDTLRACLQNAVAGDNILFDPMVFPPANAQTIALSSELPSITVDDLAIDASNAGVVLDGSSVPESTANGLCICGADGVVVKGLQVINFPDDGIEIAGGSQQVTIGGDRTIGTGPLGEGNLVSGNGGYGIYLAGSDAAWNVIAGNNVGVNHVGTAAFGNSAAGVAIREGSHDNIVGGSSSGRRNLIGGNDGDGILLAGIGTTGNQIVGNFIGTDLAGEAAIGNRNGVLLAGGAANNVIGGAHTPGVCDGPCNLISGNRHDGVALQDVDAVGTAGNKIVGNYVGTNISGDSSVPNDNGVAVGCGAADTQVGGAGAGEGNLISGNTNQGVWFSWPETTGSQVLGNTIGTDVTGSTPLPNYYGVIVSSSTDNQIGGAAPGEGNLISGNDYIGLYLTSLGTPGNSVVGNRIGTDASGTQAVPNYAGVLISDASWNTIGGATPGAGNLISGNVMFGIQIEHASVSNSLLGNLIGTDLTGAAALPNEIWGIAIGLGASSNTIGGSADGEGNLISGNGGPGIQVDGEGSTGNRILGNRVGTNLAGSAPVPNGMQGVVVIGAQETIIGGTHAPWVCEGPCNLISGNASAGVWIDGPSTSYRRIQPNPARSNEADRLADAQGNQVWGNFVGTDILGLTEIPNSHGVALLGQAVGNLVGGSTPESGNLVSGNQNFGVAVQDPGTVNNQVLGNRVGSTADGGAALPNGLVGILLRTDVAGNLVDGNLVSGNTHNAIEVLGAGTTSNTLAGNAIGVAADGYSSLPNGGSGIVFSEAHHNTVGTGNTIAHNQQAGVAIVGTQTVGNTITRNSIYLNGWEQILFYGMPSPIVPAPTLTAWDGQAVSGGACGACLVEVFANTTFEPAGRAYLDTATADGNGDFAVAVDPGDYRYLSATATDAEGTTSPFAAGLLVGDVFRRYLPLVFKGYAPAPVGWVTILSETFEGTFPGAWTVEDNQAGHGEYHWGQRTCRPFAGNHSGWAVGGGFDGVALPCGSRYPNQSYSWMVYGPFSLADATAGDLTFQLWLYSELNYDGVYRVASLDGTDFYGYRTTGNSGGWIDRTLDLTDVFYLGNLAGQPEVWIALVFESDGSINYPEGAYVDDIVLRKYVPGEGQGP